MISIKCSKCGHKGEIDPVRVLDEPEEVIDRAALIELTVAITRTGDQASADALDLLFRDEPIVREWIEQARYSRAARAAVAA